MSSSHCFLGSLHALIDFFHKFLGTAGQTIINTHTQRGLFSHLVDNIPTSHKQTLSLDVIFNSSVTKWTTFCLSNDLLQCVTSHLPHLDDHGQHSLPTFETTNYWKHANKTYSPLSMHKGNSCIQLQVNDESLFGIIQNIIRLTHTQEVLFIVCLFAPLTGSDQLRNPYRLHPHLKSHVLYREPTITRCCTVREIFGHCVIVENPPNSFGIVRPTNILVGLRSLVSPLRPNLFLFCFQIDQADQGSMFRQSLTWHQVIQTMMSRGKPVQLHN